MYVVSVCVWVCQASQAVAEFNLRLPLELPLIILPLSASAKCLISISDGIQRIPIRKLNTKTK